MARGVATVAEESDRTTPFPAIHLYLRAPSLTTGPSRRHSSDTPCPSPRQVSSPPLSAQSRTDPPAAANPADWLRRQQVGVMRPSSRLGLGFAGCHIVPFHGLDDPCHLWCSAVVARALVSWRDSHGSRSGPPHHVPPLRPVPDPGPLATRVSNSCHRMFTRCSQAVFHRDLLQAAV